MKRWLGWAVGWGLPLAALATFIVFAYAVLTTL